MKILQKKEIDLFKAKERHLEVQEGRKLAEKVDSLRELVAKEQANLTKFREETIAKVHAQIDDLINTKVALEAEVGTLENRRTNAQKPVDLKLSEIASREEVISQDKKEIADRVATLDEKKRQLDARESNVKNSEESLAQLKEAIKKASESVLLDKKNANADLREAQKIREKAQQESKRISGDLKAREDAVAARERDVLNEYAHIAEQTKHFSALERAIIDREETLDRDIKRARLNQQ